MLKICLEKRKESLKRNEITLRVSKEVLAAASILCHTMTKQIYFGYPPFSQFFDETITIAFQKGEKISEKVHSFIDCKKKYFCLSLRTRTLCGYHSSVPADDNCRLAPVPSSSDFFKMKWNPPSLIKLM